MQPPFMMEAVLMMEVVDHKPVPFLLQFIMASEFRDGIAVQMSLKFANLMNHSERERERERERAPSASFPGNELMHFVTN